ncbi:hypothetical protein ON010_g9683 [Phytophthora cinnamomi]|nr:hypothetical protein ON010_g9683 [Phytophthora cinnamomi]
MPSTAVRFGPFNYPVVNIYRLGNDSNSEYTKFAGLKGDQPVSAARVWSYQYDTTSVGFRGAVELLNVTEYQRHILTSTPLVLCGAQLLWPTTVLSVHFAITTQIPSS